MRLLVASLLSSCCMSLAAAPASSLPSNIKDACVLVRAETAHSPQHGAVGTATGTGFFIEKDLVLTCDHLTKIPMGYEMVPAENVSVEIKPGKVVSARVVRRDLKHDLALLKLRNAQDVQPFKISEFSANRGEKVTIVGNFPEALRVTRGQLLTQAVMDGFAMSSAKVRSGFSGGPIICSDGSIQGILSQRDDHNNSIFVRSDVVLDLLRSYEKKAGRTLSCIIRPGAPDPVKSIAAIAEKSAAANIAATNEAGKISTSAAGTEPGSTGAAVEPVVVAVPVRRAAAGVYTKTELTTEQPNN